MKLLTIAFIALFAMACSDRPANSSYHNSSNGHRQDNKNGNTNTGYNSNADKEIFNTNTNANVARNANVNVKK